MNSIAMLGDVLGDWAVGAQRGGEDKADFALLDYIGSSIALAGFRAVPEDGSARSGQPWAYLTP